MSRADQYAVSLTIGGTDFGVWDSMDGGEVDSNESKFAPGGMAPEVSLGGKQTVGNIKVKRLYDLNRDHTVMPYLMGAAGKVDVIVTKQPLDVDGNAFGRPLVYRGKLKTVTPPNHDSTSSDPSMLELEISSAATVS